MKAIKFLQLALMIFVFTACNNSNTQESENIQSETTENSVSEHLGPKSVLILSSSPRKDGNSQTLCEQFKKGAEEAGNRVELLNINEYDIRFFNNPDYSRNQEVVDDDATKIIKKMADADVIVLSSPTYFYAMTGQMKALIDRVFDHEKELQNKEFYYIATSADNDEEAVETVFDGFRGFARCLYGSKERGVVKGNGFDASSGEDAPAMQEAYKLGKGV